MKFVQLIVLVGCSLILSDAKGAIIFYREGSRLFVTAGRQFFLVSPFTYVKKNWSPPLPTLKNFGSPPLGLVKKFWSPKVKGDTNNGGVKE